MQANFPFSGVKVGNEKWRRVVRPSSISFSQSENSELLAAIHLVRVQVENATVIAERYRHVRGSIERDDSALVNRSRLELFARRDYFVIDHSHKNAGERMRMQRALVHERHGLDGVNRKSGIRARRQIFRMHGRIRAAADTVPDAIGSE